MSDVATRKRAKAPKAKAAETARTELGVAAEKAISTATVRERVAPGAPAVPSLGEGFGAEEFLRTFETIAEAEGGVKLLRGMVLELAVRGKLVPQVPSEGDSRQLLRMIDAQSRKILEYPFEVPSNWQWARFANVATIQSRLVDPSDFGDMPHIAPDNVEKGTGRLLSYRTIREDGVMSSKHRFVQGQLIYSKIRPNLSKVVAVDFDGLCSADMYPIVAKIERGYLHLFMLSGVFLVQVVRDDNRLAMPKVNQGQLNDTMVALPPLAEQKRIVAKVDGLMALCDDLEARQAKKRELGARLTGAALGALTSAEGPEEFNAAWARMAESFDLLSLRVSSVNALRNLVLDLAFSGRLVGPIAKDRSATSIRAEIEIAWAKKKRKDVLAEVGEGERSLSPPRWEWVRFGNIAEINGGVTKGRNLKTRKVRSYPYLRVANVQRGFLDLEVIKEIEIPEDEIEKYRLVPGDVLFTEGGDWDKLGRSTVWHGEIDGCIHQNHVFRARLVTTTVAPSWITMFANSPQGRRYFQEAAKQTTNLASINITQLRNCPVPLPPLREKQQIIAKVDQLMAICDELEAGLRRAEASAAALARAGVAAVVVG